MLGLFNVLEVVKKFGCKVFNFSFIVVYGGEMFKIDMFQYVVLQLQIVYGISKVVGEYWGNYFY